MQLVEYHTHVLEWEAEGRWRLMTTDEFQRHRQKQAHEATP